MHKYMSDITNSLKAKNKLEKAVQEFLKKNSRKIISSEDLKIFKHGIIEKLKELNIQFPKCKQFDPYFWDPSGDDQFLQGIDCICFKLFKCMEFYKDKNSIIK